MAHILDDIVDWLTDQVDEISLHDGNPGDNGANEISGSGSSGAYARLSPSYGSASSGVADLSADLEFNTPNNQQVTHIGFWRDGEPNTFWVGSPITGQPVNANSDGRIDITSAPVDQSFA